MTAQKFCDECGKPNRGQARFCGYCGQPFALLVPENEHTTTPHERKNKLQKVLILSVILCTLLGLCIATNPSPEKYSTFVQQQLIQSAKTPEERMVASLFMPLMGWGINALTERRNYYLFSVYKTCLEEAGCLKAIGILGTFIVMEVPQSSSTKQLTQADSSRGEPN